MTQADLDRTVWLCIKLFVLLVVVGALGSQCDVKQPTSAQATSPSSLLGAGAVPAAQLKRERARASELNLNATEHRRQSESVSRLRTGRGVTATSAAGENEETLARICLWEGETRKADCSAIWGVAMRVAPEGPIAFLRRYSTLDRSRTARARRIRDQPPPKTMLALAERLIAGEIANPCPRARHWGSVEDGSRGRMVPVRCTVPTANVFYRVRKA